MQIKDITNYIEKIAPLSYAENFDNVGLLVGNYSTKIKGILITLDTLEKTINEAIEKNCNLIISFHPIIFEGLKKINGNNYVERVVLKAIKNDIAIYAIHTALDNSFNGVSKKMCEALRLTNIKILIPKKNILKKLTTYVPIDYTDNLRNKLFENGAGNIGNYYNCSFNTNGKGTFKGNDKSNPIIGKKGELILQDETCISVIFESHKEKNILKSLFKNHPYEEVAYEITALNNNYQKIGMGMTGVFEQEFLENSFLDYVKKTFKTSCIRHSKKLNRPIKKIAVLGGSGSFAIKNAITSKADAYISSDFKYHDFFKAEQKILLIDIGHYESEQFTKNLLYDYLSKKFTNFAVILSEETTNPIYYF